MFVTNLNTNRVQPNTHILKTNCFGQTFHENEYPTVVLMSLGMNEKRLVWV